MVGKNYRPPLVTVRFRTTLLVPCGSIQVVSSGENVKIAHRATALNLGSRALSDMVNDPTRLRHGCSGCSIVLIISIGQGKGKNCM